MTEQIPVLPGPFANVQLVLVGETPAPLAVTLIVVPRVGMVFGFGDVSDTVTSQLVPWPITVSGHEMVVELPRFTVIEAVPLLAACPVEPLPSPG